MTFGNGSVQSFAYDAASRLSTLTNNLGGAATTHDLMQTFAYNPASQITSVTRSNDTYAWRAHYNVDRTYVANGLNRIMSVGSVAFNYDTRGNLISDGMNAYTYSAENLLKTAPGSSTLAYDPLGRLYETVKSSTTTRFQYDGTDLIAEYSGSNAVQRRYVHGPGVDNPIIWYEGGTTDSSTRRFLMADERGSVVSITDSAGATLSINSYDEYGIPAPGNIGRFGYTGQAWLPELGMWYYKARVYSPTLGRFMQTDPIGYSDGINWYNYAGSDPVNGKDPSGTSDEGLIVTGTRSSSGFGMPSIIGMTGGFVGGAQVLNMQALAVTEPTSTIVVTARRKNAAKGAPGGLDRAAFGAQGYTADLPFTDEIVVTAQETKFSGRDKRYKGVRQFAKGVARVVTDIITRPRLIQKWRTHDAERLTRAGLNIEKVWQKVQSSIFRTTDKFYFKPGETFRGSVKVDGKWVGYSAHALDEGTVSVGSIHLIK